jgi:hypothetical protein
MQPPETPLKFLSGAPIFSKKSWRGGEEEKKFRIILIEKRGLKKFNN